MEYRRLGKSGLKISELSFGSWITFANQLDLSAVKTMMHQAFDSGVNFFDNAEVYANGASELLMGEAMKEFKREDLVISTKIFWGGEGPNQRGLSFKHLIEGTNNSLKRLQTDYVDLLYCHRPDPSTPIEETVRAMDVLIRSGKAFYWGTSEWSADEIKQAHEIAREICAFPPTMEQPEYNLLNRNKVEKEFSPMYEKYGMGTTIWSPLASGILTGKYNDGMPDGSRLKEHPELGRQLTEKTIDRVKQLSKMAEELGGSCAQLAIAWCLKNPHVSSVILGATSQKQLKENLAASDLKGKINQDQYNKINELFTE